jgi:predicted ribosome quality control (RQC) complex YloA/Tae2 family protein
MLSFSEMSVLCPEVKSFLIHAQFEQITEIGDKKWRMSFLDGNEKKYLLVCLRRPFIRFHLTNKLSKGISTSFSEAIMSFLSGLHVTDIELLGSDRILSLKFSDKDRFLFLIFELFPVHPNVYLLDENWNILSSFHTVSNEEYQLPERPFTPSTVPLCCTSVLVEKAFDFLERKTVFEEKKKDLGKQLAAQLKKSNAYLQKLLNEIELGRTWETEKHTAELLQTYFFRLKKGMTEIEVEDWELEGKIVKIPLDPSQYPDQLLKRRFVISRKLKRKLEHAQKYLELSKKNSATIQERIEELSAIDHFEGLREFEKKCGIEKKPRAANAKTIKSSSPFREFATESGFKILVGKNDDQNDKLTFTIANGSDLWFHTANFPGSHVILKLKKGQPPDQESILDAAQLALYYSKAKKMKTDDIIFSECKYLSRADKNKKGLVNVAKRKLLRIQLDPQRLKRLMPNRQLQGEQ